VAGWTQRDLYASRVGPAVALYFAKYFTKEMAKAWLLGESP
jgi:hypothetical protein